jgi:hypothetical protein
LVGEGQKGVAPVLEREGVRQHGTQVDSAVGHQGAAPIPDDAPAISTRLPAASNSMAKALR